jgi:ferredoxin
VAVSNALAQPKPGEVMNSGFEPKFNPDECTACETCIDRCFGCAVCATGCEYEAITMINKPGFQEPPRNGKELKEALKASRA